MIRPDVARDRFAEIYGKAPQCVVFAPGRVNLIGEHIDYARCTVLPMAIELGITIAAGSGGDGIVFDTELDEGDSHYTSATSLVNACATAAGVDNCESVVLSDLPIGMGLSSSAALCVAMIAALASISNTGPPGSALELAESARQAESEAAGVACGLMDQYASVFGEAGCALLFDTRSVSHSELRLEDELFSFVVIDSGQPRQLGASRYNKRRTELAAGFAELRRRIGFGESFRNYSRSRILRDITDLPEPMRSRLEHAVTEQHRVELFAEQLQSGNSNQQGQLLNQSHESLSIKYEVSTRQIDLLCSMLISNPVVKGARIMGGGFGGSVLALIYNPAVNATLEKVMADYAELTGLKGGWLKVAAGDGARIWLEDGREMLVREWLG